MTIFLPCEGRTKKISAIEHANHWLKRAWPVWDHNRDDALTKIGDAMDCLDPVSAAREAVLLAVCTAGFQTEIPAAA